MSIFMDLNISYTTDKKRLQNVIETAAHLGYSTVAINYVIDFEQKKQAIPKPQPVTDLLEKLPVVQGKSRPIKVLSRLTVVASDASHFRPTAEYRSFDLVAVFPKTEKLFHAACMTFDVDIICVAVTEKQPFYFKRSPVTGAIERGLFFEINYTPSIGDSTMRRYTISNALNLMETCKGKNVILSSGAENAMQLRGPYDIANLSAGCRVFLVFEWVYCFVMWTVIYVSFMVLNENIRGLVLGLSEADAKASVSTNCRSILLHGATRATAFGVIHTTLKAQPPPTAPPEEEEEEEAAPAMKRAKTEDA